MISRDLRPQLGFTLIELMIVVAVAAILAAVAIFAYTKYLRDARIVEATNLLSKVQQRQESYFQENGFYCNDTTVWPDLASKLTSTDNYFTYTVAAGVPSGVPLAFPAPPAEVGMPTPSGGSVPWYYARGVWDMDGKGAPDTTLTVSNYRHQVVVENRGK